MRMSGSRRAMAVGVILAGILVAAVLQGVNAAQETGTSRHRPCRATR